MEQGKRAGGRPGEREWADYSQDVASKGLKRGTSRIAWRDSGMESVIIPSP